MYRIFVVEDDLGIAEGIKKQAEMWEYTVTLAADFQNVMAEFAEAEPHLVLMDIYLPYFDGYYWVREIRKVSKVPVIFISSASDNMNIIMAMNMGADDFISKPFDAYVLISKIQAILRRSYEFGTYVPVLEHRGAILNKGNGILSVGDEKTALTRNEYLILLCLMENKGKVVSREKLMERLWNTDLFIDDNSLTVNVNRLRKKLDSVGLENFISTKFGVGYIIE